MCLITYLRYICCECRRNTISNRPQHEICDQARDNEYRFGDCKTGVRQIRRQELAYWGGSCEECRSHIPKEY